MFNIQCHFPYSQNSEIQDQRMEVGVTSVSIIYHISSKCSEDLEILIFKVEQFLTGNIVIVPLN